MIYGPIQCVLLCERECAYNSVYSTVVGCGEIISEITVAVCENKYDLWPKHTVRCFFLSHTQTHS